MEDGKQTWGLTPAVEQSYKNPLTKRLNVIVDTVGTRCKLYNSEMMLYALHHSGLLKQIWNQCR